MVTLSGRKGGRPTAEVLAHDMDVVPATASDS
jgi:hypothetical protein